MLISGCLAHTDILKEIIDSEEWFDKIFGGNQKKKHTVLGVCIVSFSDCVYTSISDADVMTPDNKVYLLREKNL